MKYYIGVDIGGMSIKAGVVDENGKIVCKKTCVTRVKDGYEEIVKDIYELCKSVIASAGLTQEDISGVGIGSPGTVNSQTGIITYASNLSFKRVNIVKEFHKYWNVKTVVNNDANCAALGEVKFSDEKNVKDALFVTLGTGIGTGFIMDGKIFEGHNGEGAEGGHCCIRMGGERCSCGERGCWEAYASATALMRQTVKAMDKYPDSLMVKLTEKYGKVNGFVPFEAYEAGDKAAERVVKTYIKYVATGIIPLVNIFRPQIIFIGGGISNAGETYIKMIERQVRRHLYGGSNNTKPRIVKAQLGNDAGIVGAAAPVMD